MFENIQKQLDVIVKDLDLDEVTFDITMYGKISALGLDINRVEAMLADIIATNSKEDLEEIIFKENPEYDPLMDVQEFLDSEDGWGFQEITF